MRATLRRYYRHGLFPQLMVFEAVARLGSVTRAAGELHLAQPTVSTQLRKLADAVGLELIEWRGRELHLTAAGRELQASCSQMLELFGGLERRLAAHRPPPLITIPDHREEGDANERNPTRLQRG